jgi:hypothetical protein
VGDCANNDPVLGCGLLTLRKFLYPSYDGGRFDLLIDGFVKAAGVGHNGSTGTRVVRSGPNTVSEVAVPPAAGSNYRTTIV